MSKDLAFAYAIKRKAHTGTARPEPEEFAPEELDAIEPELEAEEPLTENTQKVDLSAIIKKHRYFASKP